jgi:hypothetical protein
MASSCALGEHLVKAKPTSMKGEDGSYEYSTLDVTPTEKSRITQLNGYLKRHYHIAVCACVIAIVVVGVINVLSPSLSPPSTNCKIDQYIGPHVLQRVTCRDGQPKPPPQSSSYAWNLAIHYEVKPSQWAEPTHRVNKITLDMHEDGKTISLQSTKVIYDWTLENTGYQKLVDLTGREYDFMITLSNPYVNTSLFAWQGFNGTHYCPRADSNGTSYGNWVLQSSTNC